MKPAYERTSGRAEIEKEKKRNLEVKKALKTQEQGM